MAGLAGAAWHAAGALAPPLLRWHLRRRARRGKEEPARLAEREGFGAARPPGRLLWLHAASVGETLAALPLLEALLLDAPGHALLTTGTVTSAEVLRRRLPESLDGRVVHRYAPLDVPAWTERFVDGWRPDLGVFLEQELWPNLLAAAARRGVPLALVNARLSARSLRGWRRTPSLARALLGRFDLILARSGPDADRFAALGVAAERWGDLKAAAGPLPHDAAELARLAALGPVWVAASTHPGEDAPVLAAHAALRTRHAALRLVIVPRHPERGPDIETRAAALGLPVARRARRDPWPPPGGVLVADTLAELGLWYRLATVALIGGSLVPAGGHNPLEAARLGCALLVGPHTDNFAEIVAALETAGGVRRVTPTPDAICAAVDDAVIDAVSTRARAMAAAAVAAGSEHLVRRTATRLRGLIANDPHGTTGTN